MWVGVYYKSSNCFVPAHTGGTNVTRRAKRFTNNAPGVSTGTTELKTVTGLGQLTVDVRAILWSSINKEGQTVSQTVQSVCMSRCPALLSVPLFGQMFIDDELCFSVVCFWCFSLYFSARGYFFLSLDSVIFCCRVEVSWICHMC